MSNSNTKKRPRRSHLVVNEEIHEHVIRTKPRGLTLQEWAERIIVIGLKMKRIPLFKSIPNGSKN